MKKKDAIKYLQQLYPNGGHCWLDEQRIEAINMAIDALKEEPVSEPNKELAETYLAVFDKKFPILPSLSGKQLADYKNFLNKCQQIFGLKEWGIRPIQSKLFEKLTLLWATWGAEHLQGIGRQDEKEQDIPVSEFMNIESMIESYKQRLISQANGVKNSPLIDMCLASYKHGINETLDTLKLSNLVRIGKNRKEPKLKVGDRIKFKGIHNEDVTRVVTDIKEGEGVGFRYFFADGSIYSIGDDEIELVEDHAILTGMNKMEQQMMAKAIDGVITFDYYDSGDKTYGCVAHDSFCLEDFGLKDKDKVKIIIIKED